MRFAVVLSGSAMISAQEEVSETWNLSQHLIVSLMLKDIIRITAMGEMGKG
jgi:hypothetical protein